MSNKLQQFEQINSFLSNFTIIQHCLQFTIIASQNSQIKYLIRNISIQNCILDQNKNQQLNQIITTLAQHQQFSSKNILKLLDFQIVSNKFSHKNYINCLNHNQQRLNKKINIRAIYQYGQRTLAKQIEDRKKSQEYFQQEALWGLLYSMASPLSYLQQKNVIYGVIDASRIFLDQNRIRILDPSSTGIDPYQIETTRLFSPELINQQRNIQQIDMFKSDVYVLGLLILQCSLLKMQLYECDQTVIQICLNQINDLYSQNFCQLISSMLILQPSQRPSFKQILKKLEDLFQISYNQIQTLQYSPPDHENQNNMIWEIEQNKQAEVIDVLQIQSSNFNSRVRQDESKMELTDFQKIKNKFFCQTSDEKRRQKDLINSNIDDSILLMSRKNNSNSFYIEDVIIKSLQKSKRTYKAKQIKDKLIKHEFVYHSEKDQQPLHANKGHKRSKTNFQQKEYELQQQDFRNKFLVQNNSKQNKNNEKQFYRPKQYNKSYQAISVLGSNGFNKENGTFSGYTGNKCSDLKQDKTLHKERSVENKNLQKKSSERCIQQKKDEFLQIDKQNLFTRPQIMRMIKNDIQRIQQKKRSKSNILMGKNQYYITEGKEVENSKLQKAVPGMPLTENDLKSRQSKNRQSVNFSYHSKENTILN